MRIWLLPQKRRIRNDKCPIQQRVKSIQVYVNTNGIKFFILEWTGTLLKFLKDQISKLQDYYTQVDKNPNTPSMNTPTETEQKLALRQWNYCVQLLKCMYEEGLLDRQEVLGWILELLEKTKSQPSEDGILRLFLPLSLQYLDEFVQSELLSRRLAHLCCKKLGFMLNNVAESNLSTSPHSEIVKTEQKEGEKEKKDAITPNPLQSTLMEYQNCPHHRDIGKNFTIFLSRVKILIFY